MASVPRSDTNDLRSAREVTAQEVRTDLTHRADGASAALVAARGRPRTRLRCTAMPGPLDEHVDAFVAGVGAELTALSGRDHTAECVVEARHIVSAILVADGRLTTGELNGWLGAIGVRLDPPVVIDVAQLEMHVRTSDLQIRNRETSSMPMNRCGTKWSSTIWKTALMMNACWTPQTPETLIENLRAALSLTLSIPPIHLPSTDLRRAAPATIPPA